MTEKQKKINKNLRLYLILTNNKMRNVLDLIKN